MTFSNARAKDYELARTIEFRTGKRLALENVRTLRRAQMTLRRWAELECGDGNGCIERDEKTGTPYWYNANSRYVGANDRRAYSRIADREAGALRRVQRVCADAGLYHYHQTDPRGCALYVSNVPLTDTNYTYGAACVV